MATKRLLIIAAIGVCAGFAGVVVQRAVTLENPHSPETAPAAASIGTASIAVPGPSVAEEVKSDAPAPIAKPRTNPADLPRTRSSARPQTPRAVAQHILVSFRDSDLGLAVRSKDEARRLAQEIARRLENGEDPAFLVEQFSDDPSSKLDRGIRRVANWGASLDPLLSETPRDALPAAYGDLLFDLERGKCGVAEYDASRNGLGFFVVKRIE